MKGIYKNALRTSLLHSSYSKLILKEKRENFNK